MGMRCKYDYHGMGSLILSLTPGKRYGSQRLEEYMNVVSHERESR